MVCPEGLCHSVEGRSDGSLLDCWTSLARDWLPVDGRSVFTDGGGKEAEEAVVLVGRELLEEGVVVVAHCCKKVEPAAPATSVLGVGAFGNR